MDGIRAPAPLDFVFGPIGIGTAAALFCGLALLATSTALHATVQGPPSNINFSRNGVGVPPSDFDVRSAGSGHSGQWVVVRDETAADGVAIERSGAAGGQDYPSHLAIYEPASLKNFDISFRFKAVAGRSEGGGVAVRLVTPRDYYVVDADALRDRVLFSRVSNGNFEEIAAVDADIAEKTWHTFVIKVEDDRVVVSLDGNWLFTGYDATLARPGRIALWTTGDSVTRFDSIAIKALPASE